MIVNKILKPGINSVITKVVQKSDTASNFNNDLNELLATPPLVEMVIRASIDAVDKHLPEGLITVGYSISLTHETATCLGMTLSVKSTLIEVYGHRLLFDFLAWDELGEVARGQHVRMVVKRDLLLQKVRERRQFMVERKYTGGF